MYLHYTFAVYVVRKIKIITWLFSKSKKFFFFFFLIATIYKVLLPYLSGPVQKFTVIVESHCLCIPTATLWKSSE